MATETKWNKFDEPRPYVGVIGFAFDKDGKFPILWRSDKVRSAKNAWSLVSGLHETGKRVSTQFINEAEEELGITRDTAIIGEDYRRIGFYEAVIYNEGWHWVMLLVAMAPFDHSKFVNKEPEKHTSVKFITVDELYDIYIRQEWTPSTVGALLLYEREIRAFAANLKNLSKPPYVSDEETAT